MITIPFVIYDDGGLNQTPQAIALVINGKLHKMKLLLKCPIQNRQAVYKDMKERFATLYPKFAWNTFSFYFFLYPANRRIVWNALRCFLKTFILPDLATQKQLQAVSTAAEIIILGLVTRLMFRGSYWTILWLPESFQSIVSKHGQVLRNDKEANIILIWLQSRRFESFSDS